MKLETRYVNGKKRKVIAWTGEDRLYNEESRFKKDADKIFYVISPQEKKFVEKWSRRIVLMDWAIKDEKKLVSSYKTKIKKLKQPLTDQDRIKNARSIINELLKKLEEEESQL